MKNKLQKRNSKFRMKVFFNNKTYHPKEYHHNKNKKRKFNLINSRNNQKKLNFKRKFKSQKINLRQTKLNIRRKLKKIIKKKLTKEKMKAYYEQLCINKKNKNIIFIFFMGF